MKELFYADIVAFIVILLRDHCYIDYRISYEQTDESIAKRIIAYAQHAFKNIARNVENTSASAAAAAAAGNSDNRVANEYCRSC